MNEQSDTLSITLKFGSWTLPMTILRSDEYVYRQAEKLVRERFNFYTNNYPGQSTEMYLVMTVLDVALKAKRQESSLDAQPLLERITPLLEELESALNENRKKS